MFDLYREERRIFEFCDYAALMAECRRIKANSVLEFGPGTSTLALVEAGCERIVTCEYQERWFGEALDRLRLYPQVSVYGYVNAAEVDVPGLARQNFDIAFVDSPLGVEARAYVPLVGQDGCSRLNTLLYALARAPVVLFHDAKRDGEQRSLQRVLQMGYAVEMIDTPKGIARICRASIGAAP